jgi:hypothetical protein
MGNADPQVESHAEAQDRERTRNPLFVYGLSAQTDKK